MSNSANEESVEFSSVSILGVGWIDAGISAFYLQKTLQPVQAEFAPSLHARIDQEVIAEHGKKRRSFKKNKLGQYQFRSGSFSEDARGRWYFNGMVEVPITKSSQPSAVGIELGLKD
jgi:hypothetical protein